MDGIKYDKLIDKIASAYKSIIIVGEDIDNNVYVRLDKITVISKLYLYVEDTGYGKDYNDACKNLISIYTNPSYRLRYNRKIYATRKIRSIIKKFYKESAIVLENKNIENENQ